MLCIRFPEHGKAYPSLSLKVVEALGEDTEHHPFVTFF